MLIYRQESLFESPAETWVNAVNCVGVMGKGLALEFKIRFPEMFSEYKAVCDRGELRSGILHVHEFAADLRPRFIINFPTKRHWRDPSRLEDIKTGLVALRTEIERRKLKSIAIPALGCGLGGLPWEQVRAVIEDTLTGIENVQVFVYPPLPVFTQARS
jgi:O-acetyl-ADP-ribose deacetylase (regulator of RNase III)